MRGPDWLTRLSRPWCSGHRGAGGLSKANTLASFEHALSWQCDLLEADIQRTRDGHLVLVHDERIEVADVSITVSTLSLEELRALPGHGDVPTLIDFLQLSHGRAVPLIDLKGTGYEAQIGVEVRAAGVDRAIVCGGSLESLLKVRLAHGVIATSLTLDVQALQRVIADPSLLKRIPTDMVTAEHCGLTIELIQQFHEAGIWVVAWTVDRPAAMKTLARMGVDGITTNRPDLLQTARAHGVLLE
ncbi:MAG: glycerophosphodiester phosphodiesterase [Chloroflexi bacterium]|nr:glycerophosphodiester phosphodiesterase [Chloroflexota bacterium]